LQGFFALEYDGVHQVYLGTIEAGIVVSGFVAVFALLFAKYLLLNRGRQLGQFGGSDGLGGNGLYLMPRAHAHFTLEVDFYGFGHGSHPDQGVDEDHFQRFEVGGRLAKNSHLAALLNGNHHVFLAVLASCHVHEKEHGKTNKD
jgi:hypothetical protein